MSSSQTERPDAAGPAPARSRASRAVRAATSGVGRFLRDFVRQSLHLTLYLVVVAGLVALALQIPKVKQAFKARVAHVQEKYLGAAAKNAAGGGPQAGGDIQARLDGMENTLQSSLTDIRLAVSHANIGAGPAAGPGTPLPGKPADVRLLPYPFHSYLSVTSDPDMMTFADFEAIHRLLDETYQLPLSDQLFCSDSSVKKTPGESGLNLDFGRTPPGPVDPTRFHRLLMASHRGWVDGIHGWHARAVASRDEAFRLEGGATREVAIEDEHLADPRDEVHLVFEYRLPHFRGRFSVRAGAEPLAVRSSADQTPATGPAVTWTPVFARLPAGAGRTFTFECEPAGAALDVRHLMVTNFSRPRVDAEARFMDEYGLRFLVYSEHGRVRNELAAGLRHDTEGVSRSIALADNPAAAANFYAMPALERVGVTFLNAAHFTGDTVVLPVTDLVHPLRFNDGVVRYNFRRYLAYPLGKDGERQIPKDLSWEPWLGFHLRKLLAASGRFGDGGTVYTHWGVGGPKDRALGPETRKELEALRERYYNLSGRTPRWERVWVAPTAEVLLYSRAVRAVRDHASYDEGRNAVHLRSWYDPVARQTVPAPRTRAFGLADLTFYVTRSATARLFIDGREYTCLKRNPADQTGRESVTIIDDSVPSVVLDEVDPLHRFGDLRSEGVDAYFRQADGFRGARSLELVAQEPAGRAELKVPAVTADSATFVRFACRKSNPSCRVSVRVAFDDGSELLATEGPLGTATGWAVTPAADAGWHDHVFALYDLEGPRPLRAPRGPVKAVTFEVAGATPGDKVQFDTVEFLRHPTQPPSPTGRHLVGGRVDPPTDGVKVVLEDGPGRMETKTHGGGYFYFPHAAETGAAVRVYAVPADGQPRPPTAGRALEVRRDEVRLAIPLTDLRDAGRKGPLQKKTKFESELNAKVGRVYKPRSDYVHCGIGTPQEFENHLQISNLGFLDRDRRPENPDNARRVLFLGNCNLFGHSTPRAYHPNILLEDLLRRRSGYPTEVVALADSAMSFGKHWSYYRELGRPFKPEVVCIFLQSSGVEMMEADPDAFARFNEYRPGHFPCSLFCGRPDGGLALIEPDPEYFRFVGKDPDLRAAREAEKKKGGYYSDGVDWNTVYYRTDWDAVPAPARKAWDHFARVLRHYREELAKDGTRLVIVLTPEVQLSVGGLNKDFTDVDGHPCNSRLAPERIERLCRDLSVGYLNIAPAAIKSLPSPSFYIWRHDGHPSPYGNRVAAEAVADYLLRTNFARPDAGPD